MPKRLPLLDDPARVVIARRPRCRVCGSVKLRAVRTLDTDGDEICRRVRCATCGAKLILILT